MVLLTVKVTTECSNPASPHLFFAHQRWNVNCYVRTRSCDDSQSLSWTDPKNDHNGNAQLWATIDIRANLISQAWVVSSRVFQQRVITKIAIHTGNHTFARDRARLLIRFNEEARGNVTIKTSCPPADRW